MLNKAMQIRLAVCYSLLLVGMFFSIIRIASINLSPKYADAAENESTRRMVLGAKRGTIFDCNLERLTNHTRRYVSIITDHPAAVMAVSEQFSGEELTGLLTEIRQNGMAVRTIDRELMVDGIVSLPVSEHAGDDLLAKHLIGYTDDSNHGVCGLEAAFDEILYTDETAEIAFITDGHGNILPGETPEIVNPVSCENSGIAVTLDRRIQTVAEQAADGLTCGAVIVTEAKTGKIRAMVSRPDYRMSDLASALTDENSPLLNRALCAYNVGSVFKPCVAAAALENRTTDFLYTCIGYADIDGLTFRCHKADGHGAVDLSAAIKYSCNTFFYNFSSVVGADAIYDMAARAGFSSGIKLADGITAASGNIGNLSALRLSRRALANLAIGQGELMLTPVGITTLYMAIASDGTYRIPSLIEGRVENGVLTERETDPAPVRLMSAQNAALLRQYLAGVLEEGGTGTAAKPGTVTAGGKTATAQTGILKDGHSVINSWFCGFFPLEEPEYVVTVLAENASGGCAGVFAKIADGVMEVDK